MFDQIDLKMSTFNGQSMRVTADGLQQTCQEKRFIIKYAPRNKCNDSKPGFTVHLVYFSKSAAPGQAVCGVLFSGVYKFFHGTHGHRLIQDVVRGQPQLENQPGTHLIQKIGDEIRHIGG